jgi:hypothetical protein
VTASASPHASCSLIVAKASNAGGAVGSLAEPSLDDSSGGGVLVGVLLILLAALGPRPSVHQGDVVKGVFW